MKRNEKNKFDAIREKLSTIKTAWEKAYEDEDKIEELPWVSTELPTEILKNFVQIIRPCSNDDTLTILDFGCGTGRIGKKLIEQQNIDVYYHDVSANALNYCLQHGIEKEFVISDVEHCDKRFDGIIAWGVFHHIDPILWEYEMDLILGLLKPNGHLLFCDFSDEDRLFEKKQSRKSEVTQLLTYAVNFNFIKSKINAEEESYFDFEENKDFSTRKPEKRRMKYVIGAFPLVERQRKIVKNQVEEKKPSFWHFIEYSFDTSLTVPQGNAVRFFDDAANPEIAIQLWREGLSLLKDFDEKKILEQKLFSTSLSNSLFLGSSKRLSFFVKSEEDDHVSLSIRQSYFCEFEYYEIELKAPAVDFAFNDKIEIKDSSRSFDVFYNAIKRRVEKEPVSKGISDQDYRDLVCKIQSVKTLEPLTVSVMMMILFVWPSLSCKAKSFVIVIPPVFEDRETTKQVKEIAAGGVVMFSKGGFSIRKTDALLFNIERWANLFTVERIVAYTRKQSVRSAIAQVMARNLSHNYGSHVLNHLLRASLDTFAFKNSPYKSQYNDTIGPKAKQKELYWQIIYLIRQLDDELKAIKEIKEVDDKVVDKLWEAIQGVSPEQPENLTNESLRQVVYLLNHIKCRVDYISDISFGAPTIQTSRCVFGDIFMELDRVSLLMNHISGLEERFTYKIVLRGPDKDDKKKLRILGKDHDIQVAVPNDVVGTQAFYNILENIIRNTAKHSHGTSKSGSVTFHIDFSEMTSTGDWEETIRDEALKYYCVEIYDNISMNPGVAEELVNAQNKRLNDPIFEGERPRSHSLGLVEMEASAAYLRKLDSSVIDDELYHVINKEQNSELYEKYKDLYYNQYGQFNLLKAIMKPDDKGKYYFGYRFFMLRPQEVLLVVDVVDDNQKKEFLPLHNPKEGVWIVSKTEFETALSDDKVFNHEFVVFEGEDVREHIERHKMALSPRVLQKNIKAWLDNKTSPNDIVKDCWQQWHEENTPDQEDKDKEWKYSSFRTCYDNKDYEAVYLDHMGTDTFSFEEATYCEALSSNAQIKLPGFQHEDISDYLVFLDENKEHNNRNLESVNNKVLIMDERIQDAAEKQKEYGKFLKEHYKKMNVTVPELSYLNLLETNISKVAGSIKEYIAQHGPSHDFVLIHYGILERIFMAADNNKWKDKLDDYLKELSEIGPRIILTSGRGVPGGLPPCVGFVSLSSVTAALIDYKSKYLLNCLMYAARKTTN